MKKIIIKTEILGRDVQVIFLDFDNLVKVVESMGETKEHAERLNGFCSPDNKIYICLRDAYIGFSGKQTKENTIYLFDAMGQTLWHEVGHLIDRYAIGSIQQGEWTPTVGENYFMLQKTLNNIIKELKERLK